jgi:hypothetical protein
MERRCLQLCKDLFFLICGKTGVAGQTDGNTSVEAGLYIENAGRRQIWIGLKSSVAVCSQRRSGRQYLYSVKSGPREGLA